MASPAETQVLQRLKESRQWIQPDSRSKIRISEADYIDPQKFPGALGIFIHVPSRGDGLKPGLYFSPLGVISPQWEDEDAHEFRQAVTNYVNTAVSNPEQSLFEGLSGNIALQFRLEVANAYDPEEPESVLLRLVSEDPGTVGDMIAAGIIARRGEEAIDPLRDNISNN